MTNLIDRIEGAEAGSRALDGDVLRALGYRVVRHPTLDDWWWTKEGVYPLPTVAERPSQSVDAALALAELVLPGRSLELVSDNSRWSACMNMDDWQSYSGFLATPALALCAAILRGIYCREPRPEPLGYLCDRCLTKTDSLGRSIAEQYDYSGLFVPPAPAPDKEG